MYSTEEVITIPEMIKRLKLNKQYAYELIKKPGFPLYNLGGIRQNRVIWGDVLEWIRTNAKVGDESA